jgi:hypothetical protein
VESTTIAEEVKTYFAIPLADAAGYACG